MHSCPDCGSRCTCHGDLDDLEMELEKASCECECRFLDVEVAEDDEEC